MSENRQHMDAIVHAFDRRAARASRKVSVELFDGLTPGP